ncbi:Splicing factor 3B subunit 1 [Hondaea fermentalgiana]|uniref:Splicing factor 3B subunit 1 n=1 Tax=Hondaea fermentalgiana TaxID=2315210 RepID=A0A2R5GH23_9STRA|nr:Splicing factor 3B subunit 1 [Hondaea fermentalgiana]|eukprot:GBG27571.1 Splicing factor 3B subunit 1 [Hondaea fermentalgiana]
MSGHEIKDLTALRGASHPAFRGEGAQADGNEGDEAEDAQALRDHLENASGTKSTRIVDNESDYQKQRHKMGDMLKHGNETYQERMARRKAEDLAARSAHQEPMAVDDALETQSDAGASVATSATIMTRAERDIAERNRPLTDEELDAMLPSEGYAVVAPPASYKPPTRDATSIIVDASSLTVSGGEDVNGPTSSGATALDENASPEERVGALLQRIMDGTPAQRKVGLRHISRRAREFGAGAIFGQVLPMMMSPTLENQQRHLLVKVIGRVLYRLDDLVCPYVDQILVPVMPLLIDEDFFARAEGREIIANLSKAAGVPTMIAALRPNVDHKEEYVRNVTARAFAVVASAMGIASLVPFLRAVCASKSWHARHTGVKVVQQIAVLVGCAVLPHLTSLVGVVKNGLEDKVTRVRDMTALALAALAESAHPYGIESFDPVLEPLWHGVRQHQGKTLASFLKAVGALIPLFDDEEYASYFAKEVMAILIREFKSSDDEMRRICLHVLRQCVKSDCVTAAYLRESVCPEYFRNFWIRRMALERRNAKQVVETTTTLANKLGAADVVARIVDELKDENEAYRRMVMEALSEIVANLGAADISLNLEQRLVDGAMYAFQEQGSVAAKSSAEDSRQVDRESATILSGFSTILNALGERSKPYLAQIAGIIKFRLNSKDAVIRAQAADLCALVAPLLKLCKEDQLLAHLSVVLFENLGEEYPGVLGSIIGGLAGIVSSIGMTKMAPPIKDLLPRVTPILKNQNPKVQENAIALVGRIAARAPEQVAAREWMRICFELIELLRAKQKSIRRAAVATFGYIAEAVGPQDITHALLNNLKVADRSSRVCSTVGLAVVAESCGPFTVLPSLLTDYRFTDSNVQHGVLKSLSFLFQYIGESSKDYIYSVITLLTDALCQRDAVHRQTACSVVKHLALGVYGAGCEDALVHLLNFVWPNIFEESPHVIAAVFEAVEGIRVALGAHMVFLYVLQGLFHPARRVREVYWRIHNNLYVYGGEKLIPVYPRLPPDYALPESRPTDISARKHQLVEVLSAPKAEAEIRNSYENTYLDLFV